jgi:hypothetical protein
VERTLIYLQTESYPDQRKKNPTFVKRLVVVAAAAGRTETANF